MIYDVILFFRISSVFSPDLSDNCMISVYPFGDELFALTEFPTMIRVDPATLNTENSVIYIIHIECLNNHLM